MDCLLLVSKSATMIMAETEYIDGIEDGAHRDFYSNSSNQIAVEYHVSEGGVNGLYREWDVGGKLVYDALWQRGLEVECYVNLK